MGNKDIRKVSQLPPLPVLARNSVWRTHDYFNLQKIQYPLKFINWAATIKFNKSRSKWVSYFINLTKTQLK
jgi:hypothetical protein